MCIFAYLRGSGGNRIVMKFCIDVITDVITRANLGVSEEVGVKFPTFPLTCIVVLKTLSHYP